ncbi:hypothetical protein ACIP5Y_16175 [Nocardia sp. NPDC088792]|uniref:hypothetical protein n=1 Tax=Nocardia sp. NPDC088792 TaxID=3364332 RepID=UPI0038191A52
MAIVVGIGLVIHFMAERQSPQPSPSPLARVPSAKAPSVVVARGDNCGAFDPSGTPAQQWLALYASDYLPTVVHGSITCGAADAALAEAYTQVKSFDIEFTTTGGWNCFVASPLSKDTELPNRAMDCRKDTTELALQKFVIPVPK